MWLGLLLSSSAPAAGPPPLELLDDLNRWEAGQDALIEGPRGCWELSGRGKLVVTLHQPPDFLSAARNQAYVFEGPFTARMVDGTWKELKSELKAAKEDELEVDIDLHPLFGVRPETNEEIEEVSIELGGGDPQISASLDQSANLLRRAIDELTGSVETSLAQWDAEQEAVVYLREVPVSDKDRRAVKVNVRFPGAGPHADRLDAVWPRMVKVGEWPLFVKVRDGQAHLQGFVHEGAGGAVVLPLAETMSFVVGALGYTLGFEQAMTYEGATPCSEPPAGPPPSAG